MNINDEVIQLLLSLATIAFTFGMFVVSLIAIVYNGYHGVSRQSKVYFVGMVVFFLLDTPLTVLNFALGFIILYLSFVYIKDMVILKRLKSKRKRKFSLSILLLIVLLILGNLYRFLV